MWNPTDDYAYVNGHKTAVKCYLNSLPLFANGNLQLPAESNQYNIGTGFTLKGGFNVQNNALVPTVDVFNGQCVTLVFTDSIDVTNYSKLKATTNYGTYELNLQSVSGSVYITVDCHSNGARRFGLGACSQKASFADHTLAYLDELIDSHGVVTNFQIQALELL